MLNLSIRNDPALSRRTSEDARQYVYRVLRHCIMVFLLTPGQKLNEMDLAQSLQVSRTPVHDTISKLSRERMVDLYANRGAFVSRLCCRSIEQAVWTHIHMGKAVLYNIYVCKTPKSRLSTLYFQLDQMSDVIDQGRFSDFLPALLEFYHSLYVMSDDRELVWKSLRNVDTDLCRFLHLASGSTTVTTGFVNELNALADAMLARNIDRAFGIYEKHFSRMLLLVSPARSHNPDYFITERDG